MPDSDRGGAPTEITGLLHDLAAGRSGAHDELIPLVYDQLSRLAHARLRHERPGHTLETAGLVHEAWLRIADQNADWQNRRHFFGVASEVMRRILVDHAKARRRLKRGGDAAHLPLDELEGSLADPASAADSDDAIVALDGALVRLAHFNPTGVQVVQYRFFVGLSNQEVAELLGTSERTVRRSWTAARAWLHRDLTDRGFALPTVG